MQKDLDSQRLDAIEERLDKIEQHLGIKIKQRISDDAVAQFFQPSPLQQTTAKTTTQKSAILADKNKLEDESHNIATTILGWTGATALVLAAAYIIRLAIQSGWLTPERQVALAVITGIILIAIGLLFRNIDRRYASLLPAGGVVILFLSVYGAHLYYPIITTGTATVSIILTCGLALWLCQIFRLNLYAFFAILGSYSAPFLLSSFTAGQLLDLIAYYLCWSIVFCIYATKIKERTIYLLALYLAMIGFDWLWRNSSSDNWSGALIFQSIQLAIFATTTAIFSIRHKSPLSNSVAMLHIPGLMIFYFLQYTLLQQHLPDYAPWISIITAFVLLGIYVTTRYIMKKPLPGGELLLGAYVALVIFHAIYIELTPAFAAPWFAIILLSFATTAGKIKNDMTTVSYPVWIVIALIFSINYLRLILWGDKDNNIPLYELLILLYAVSFYLGYRFIRKTDFKSPVEIKNVLLYGGHIALLAAAVHILDNSIAVSTSWAIIAVTCLFLSLKYRDKFLGQSSLLIFAVTVAKVVGYDLSASSQGIRIVSLIIVGISLYIGGWLYKRVNALESTS